MVTDARPDPRGGLRASPCVLVTLSLILYSGCGQPEVADPPIRPASGAGDRPRVSERPTPNPPRASGFGPARITILPLTELVEAEAGSQGARLRVYVTLLDAFGSSIKAPGSLRFELYEYVPRSAEPKGQRIAFRPGVDLTSAVENNKYWRDFLRAYEFEFDVPASRDRTYILEVTCLFLDKRLAGEFMLRPAS